VFREKLLYNFNYIIIEVIDSNDIKTYCMDYSKRISNMCKIIRDETKILIYNRCYSCQRKYNMIEKIRSKILDLEYELYKMGIVKEN